MDFSSEPIPTQNDPRDSRHDAVHTEDERQKGKGGGKQTKCCKERDSFGTFCDSSEVIDGSRPTEVGNKASLLRQNGKRQKDTPIGQEASEEERRAEGVAGGIVGGECQRNGGVDEEV